MSTTLSHNYGSSTLFLCSWQNSLVFLFLKTCLLYSLGTLLLRSCRTAWSKTVTTSPRHFCTSTGKLSSFSSLNLLQRHPYYTFLVHNAYLFYFVLLFVSFVRSLKCSLSSDWHFWHLWVKFHLFTIHPICCTPFHLYFGRNHSLQHHLPSLLICSPSTKSMLL